MTNHLSEDVSSTDFNIMDEMEKNISLKAGLFGGNPVVIAPVAPPPSFREVQTWSRARELYKTMKAKAGTSKTLQETETKDAKQTVVSSNEHGNKSVDTEVKSPKFTKLKEQKSVTFDDVTIIDFDDEDETPSKKTRSKSTPKSSTRPVSKTPAKSAIKKSKIPSPELEIIDDDEHGTSDVISPSPPAKRIKTRSSQVSTSTPRRRVPLEQEFPPCTPIQSSVGHKAGVTPSPTTPKSSSAFRSTRRGRETPPPATPSTSMGKTTTPPLTPTSSQVHGLKRLSRRLSQRRLSSGMEASLRRLLVASQLKVYRINLVAYISNNTICVSI